MWLIMCSKTLITIYFYAFRIRHQPFKAELWREPATVGSYHDMCGDSFLLRRLFSLFVIRRKTAGTQTSTWLQLRFKPFPFCSYVCMYVRACMCVCTQRKLSFFSCSSFLLACGWTDRYTSVRMWLGTKVSPKKKNCVYSIAIKFYWLPLSLT